MINIVIEVHFILWSVKVKGWHGSVGTHIPPLTSLFYKYTHTHHMQPPYACIMYI